MSHGYKDTGHPLILRGERFGDLVVEDEAKRRATGQRQMVLRCDCGRPALRTVDYLLSLKRRQRSAISMCSECLREMNRGETVSRRAAIREALLLRWEETGEIWSDLWERREISALRAEFGLVETVELPEDAVLSAHSAAAHGYMQLSPSIEPNPFFEERPHKAELPEQERLYWQKMYAVHPRRYFNHERVWCSACGQVWSLSEQSRLGASWYEPAQASPLGGLIWPTGKEVAA